MSIKTFLSNILLVTFASQTVDNQNPKFEAGALKQDSGFTIDTIIQQGAEKELFLAKFSKNGGLEKINGEEISINLTSDDPLLQLSEVKSSDWKKRLSADKIGIVSYRAETFDPADTDYGLEGTLNVQSDMAQLEGAKELSKAEAERKTIGRVLNLKP